MERRLFKRCIGVALAAGLVVAPGSSIGEEEHGSHHGMAEKAKPAAGPETLGGVWQTVKARESDLSNLIRAKDLGKVHEVAFAIRDLVAALPEKSGQLSAEQQAKLRGNVKYVATLAERLDTTGDSKDQAGTEAGFKQLQSVLAAIEKLYPPGALK